MPTYKFEYNKEIGSITLVYRKSRITALRAKGHVWVKITSSPYGKNFKLQGLTSISDSINDFELKFVLLFFAKQARDYGKNMPSLNYINYANIFGSIFD